MSKLPAFFFYTGDWLKDPALRRCTHAEKGVWIDMLCLMWENDESRGVLITGSRPWSLEEVAMAVGGDLDSVKGHISALLSKGVAKRRADGAIYCARMVRDEDRRRATALRVKNHRNASVTPHPGVTLEDESEDEDENENENKSVAESAGGKIDSEQCLTIYGHYPRKVGKPTALREIRKAGAKFGYEKLLEATIAFAKAVAGKEERYIPHPSTWFHQERFNDDPSTWSNQSIQPDHSRF